MVIVPSDECIHQHFNTGTTRARYLAFHPGQMGTRNPHPGGHLSGVSEKEGGWQIEYDDQNPIVNKIFEAELEKNGSHSCMARFFKKTS